MRRHHEVLNEPCQSNGAARVDPVQINPKRRIEADTGPRPTTGDATRNRAVTGESGIGTRATKAYHGRGPRAWRRIHALRKLPSTAASLVYPPLVRLKRRLRLPTRTQPLCFP